MDGYRTLAFQFWVRLFFIGCNLFIVVLAAFRGLWATSLVATLPLVVQGVSLMRALERIQRDFYQFVESIKSSDYRLKFLSTGPENLQSALANLYTTVMKRLDHERFIWESRLQYLNSVLQHLNIGLLTMKNNGVIDLFNPEAARILNRTMPRNLSDLESMQPELAQTVQQLRPGEHVLLNITREQEPIQLLLSAMSIRTQGQKFKLITLQDIRSVFDEIELDAWQNLIRTLTHEIMNSMTPITSLAASVLERWETERDPGTSAELHHDTLLALDAIKKRSEGLMQFVENYRRLARTLIPHITRISVIELFRRIERLMITKLSSSGVRLILSSEPEDLEIYVDPELFEQVLINLVVNATEAVQNRPDPMITLRASLNPKGRCQIHVIDNGPGIPENLLGKVFVPFFTTKPNGSGIGLSISRQIVRAHNGTLAVSSPPIGGTVVTITL